MPDIDMTRIEMIREIYLEAFTGHLSNRESIEAAEEFHGRMFDEAIRELQAETLESAADEYYNCVSGSKTRPWARTWLRERAARIRRGQ